MASKDFSGIKNSYDLIQHFMKLENYEPQWQCVYSQDKRRMSYANHENHLILWSQEHEISKDLWNTRCLAAGYRKLQDECYQKLVKSIAEELTKAPKRLECDFQALADLLKLSEVDQLVLLWWLSDRKAALLSLVEDGEYRSTQPPMPIFYSIKGGTGKSTFVEKLLMPLRELAVVKRIRDIEDNFGHLQYARVLAVNFDEMAGADRVDLKNFKQWFFADTYTQRKMHSEQNETIHKICHCIGSSNTPFSETINDTTGGSRRFYDINALTDGTLHKLSKEFDFVSLWQSLRSDIKPTIEELKIIREEQSLQRRKHILEIWFEEEGFGLLKDKNPYPAQDYYYCFEQWRRARNEIPVSATMFGKKLPEIYEHIIKKERINSGVIYSLVLDPSC